MKKTVKEQQEFNDKLKNKLEILEKEIIKLKEKIFKK